MFSRKSNAIKGLNFPSRRLNITIKHRENERRKMMKISAAFMLFRTAHNMNEPLMYVWLCFNNPFFCRLSLVSAGGRMKISQRTMREIKQHTLQNGRVDEEIIAQFSFSCENLRAPNFHLIQKRQTFHFCTLSGSRQSIELQFVSRFRGKTIFPSSPRDHTQPEVPLYPQIMANQKSLKLAKAKKSFSTRAFE